MNRHRCGLPPHLPDEGGKCLFIFRIHYKHSLHYFLGNDDTVKTVLCGVFDIDISAGGVSSVKSGFPCI